MDHKAFAFDWNAFDTVLRPILEEALRTGVTDPLVRWIEEKKEDLTDPYEGEPLPADWQSLLETGDAQNLGDIALTRFYRPQEDAGLHGAWLSVSEGLPPEAQVALLGSPVGPPENLFDPGLMGSYFQPPDQARRSLQVLRELNLESLAPMRELLERCSSDGQGVYVTF